MLNLLQVTQKLDVKFANYEIPDEIVLFIFLQLSNCMSN